jgi:ABC-2 type transport system permease protein
MLWRNVTFWLISIFIAILSMLVFGLLFKPEAQAFDLAVVDEDRTKSSQQLAAAFAGLDNIEFKNGSRDDELASLKDGDRGAVVIIPQGFAEALAAADAAIEVYYDNSNLIRIGYVTSTVEATVQAYNEQVAGSPAAVGISAAAIDTETVRFIDFLAPGMVGMTIMFTNLAVGFLLVNWREMGILRRLGVTPLKPGILIGSQAVSFAFVSLAQVTLVLGVGKLVFDVSVQGSYLWLALTALIGVVCMLSIGYTIASFARTVQSFSAVQQLVSFPMLFLGRSYFPIDPSPALKPVVEFVPLTHLNDALREIINHGGGPSDLWVSWLVLLAWAAAGYLLSMRVFRWQ